MKRYHRLLPTDQQWCHSLAQRARLQPIKQPKGYATMSKNNVIELEGREASAHPLSELLLFGAQKLLFQAVEGLP
jgi:hypothetical protein